MEEIQADPPKVRKKRRRQPTLMQIKALQYKNQGMSSRQAMLKAGYSEVSASRPQINLFNRDGVKEMINSMAGELMDKDLTTKYMAAKFAEWMKAEKVHASPTEPDRLVPDYDTQLKAYDRWKKVFDEQVGGVGSKGVKRKLTIEEFVTGGDEGSA